MKSKRHEPANVHHTDTTLKGELRQAAKCEQLSTITFLDDEQKKNRQSTAMFNGTL